MQAPAWYYNQLSMAHLLQRHERARISKQKRNKRYRERKKAEQREQAEKKARLDLFYGQPYTKASKELTERGWHIQRNAVDATTLNELHDLAINQKSNLVKKIGDEDKRFMRVFKRTIPKIIHEVADLSLHILGQDDEDNRQSPILYKPSFLYSRSGCSSQRLHLDYEATHLTQLSKHTRPFVCIVAFEDGTKLDVLAHPKHQYDVGIQDGEIAYTVGDEQKYLEGKQRVSIVLKKGDILFLRGDAIHAGSAYKDCNSRLHMYFAPEVWIEGVGKKALITYALEEESSPSTPSACSKVSCEMCKIYA